MKKLLVLAFLLYDIIAIATRLNNYDYDDNMDGSKRHPMLDDGRNWRKKAMSKSMESYRDRDRKRYDYETQRYMDDMDYKSFNNLDRQREMELSAGYRNRHRRFEDVVDKMNNMQTGLKSSSENHPSSFPDKDSENKFPVEMSCQKPHEKYESCFGGCASVTCDNPRDRMQPCYPFCEAGCVCVHPYVRDDRTHKCVLPEDCTKGLKGIPDLGDEATAR